MARTWVHYAEWPKSDRARQRPYISLYVEFKQKEKQSNEKVVDTVNRLVIAEMGSQGGQNVWRWSEGNHPSKICRLGVHIRQKPKWSKVKEILYIKFSIMFNSDGEMGRYEGSSQVDIAYCQVRALEFIMKLLKIQGSPQTKTTKGHKTRITIHSNSGQVLGFWHYSIIKDFTDNVSFYFIYLFIFRKSAGTGSVRFLKPRRHGG